MVLVWGGGGWRGWHMVTWEALSRVPEPKLCLVYDTQRGRKHGLRVSEASRLYAWMVEGIGAEGVGLRFRDVWRWPELKRATFWFWTGPFPGRLAGHKAGWGLRIMAAEGRGGRQLANSAPICFHERGEEISEDAMPERHARRQKWKIKNKIS